MEGADQIQALEEHFHCSVIDSGLMLIQTSPIELWIKTAAIDSGLIIGELTRFPEPAIGIAVEPAPIQERIDVDRFPCQQDAVLLKTALKLEVLLLSSGQGIDAGRQGYRR